MKAQSSSVFRSRWFLPQARSHGPGMLLSIPVGLSWQCRWCRAGIAALLGVAVPVPGAFLWLTREGFCRQALPAPVSCLLMVGAKAGL